MQNPKLNQNLREWLELNIPEENWPLAVRILEGKDDNLALVSKGLEIGQELTNKDWERKEINWRANIKGLEMALDSKSSVNITVSISPFVYLFIFLTAILVYVATRY